MATNFYTWTEPGVHKILFCCRWYKSNTILAHNEVLCNRKLSDACHEILFLGMTCSVIIYDFNVEFYNKPIVMENTILNVGNIVSPSLLPFAFKREHLLSFKDHVIMICFSVTRSLKEKKINHSFFQRSCNAAFEDHVTLFKDHVTL